MGPPEVWEMREIGASNELKPMLDAPETALLSNDPETHVTVSTNADMRLPDDESLRRRSHQADPERRLSNAVADDGDGSSTKRPWLFNHNRYATRKTAAQGMMDMALMLANASQLKSVLQEGPVHPHYILLLSLITISIGLQISTGLLLLVVGARESNYDDNDEKRNLKTSKLNNMTVAMVFLITITNIFITSFGINGDTSAVSASGHGSGSVSAYDAGIGGGEVNDPATVT